MRWTISGTIQVLINVCEVTLLKSTAYRLPIYLVRLGSKHRLSSQRKAATILVVHRLARRRPKEIPARCRTVYPYFVYYTAGAGDEN